MGSARFILSALIIVGVCGLRAAEVEPVRRPPPIMYRLPTPPTPAPPPAPPRAEPPTPALPVSASVPLTPPPTPAIPSHLSLNATTVGVILPLSGTYASYGAHALVAVQMALGLPVTQTVGTSVWTQAAGGVTLVVGDSKSNPQTAASLVQEMAEKYGVMVVLGDILNDTGLAVSKKANEMGIPNVSLSRRAGLTNLGPFVFRLGLTTDKQTKALVNKAVGELGLKRIAILYPEHAFGIEMKDSFMKEAKAKGAHVVTALSYPSTETNFGKLIAKLIGPQNYSACAKETKKELEQCKSKIAPVLRFEALFIPDFQKTLSYILPTLMTQDVLISQNSRVVSGFQKSKSGSVPKPLQLLGPNSWKGPLLSERLGKQMEGALFVDGVDLSASNELGSKWAAEYQKLVSSPPSLVEAQAYDAALLMKAILFPTTGNGPKTRLDFMSRLASVKDVKGLTGTLSFDDARESATPLKWFVFKEDQVELLP